MTLVLLYSPAATKQIGNPASCWTLRYLQTYTQRSRAGEGPFGRQYFSAFGRTLLEKYLEIVIFRSVGRT